MDDRLTTIQEGTRLHAPRDWGNLIPQNTTEDFGSWEKQPNVQAARRDRGIFEVISDVEDYSTILSYGRVKHGTLDALAVL